MPNGLRLTLKEGLAIQAEQLAEWKLVLNDHTMAAMNKRAECANGSDLTLATHNLEDHKKGFEVWRGTDMDQFLSDYIHMLKCRERDLS